MKRSTAIIIFITLLLGMELFAYIPAGIFNIDIFNLDEKMKIYYILSTDIGYMIIIFVLYHKDLIKEFKAYFKNFIYNFSHSFIYYLIGIIIMFICNELIAHFFSEATANNEEMIRLFIDRYPLYMIFSVTIYAPFVEEIVFRKCTKDIIANGKSNKITKYSYIIVSGLFFAIMHVVGLANNPIDYLYIISYMSLGITFAYIYYKTDNLFNTIILHSFHNSTAIILYFILGG